VDSPDIQLDADAAECIAPGEDVGVDAVDECAVEVEDEGALAAGAVEVGGGGRHEDSHNRSDVKWHIAGEDAGREEMRIKIKIRIKIRKRIKRKIKSKSRIRSSGIGKLTACSVGINFMI